MRSSSKSITSLLSSLATVSIVLAPIGALAGPKESCFALFRTVELQDLKVTAAQANEPRVDVILTPREPLPPDREPLFAKDRAQEIAKGTDKLGEYALVTVGLSTEVKLKVIVDAKADWLTRAVQTFAGKPVEQLEQKTIKAFLEHLSRTDLKTLLTQRLRQYRGEMRDVKRDGEPYYLEELILSGKQDELVVALIGQSLLEAYAKKDSRIVEIDLEGEKVRRFGLMILNGNPDVLIPGKCSNMACGAGTIVRSADIKSRVAPSFANVKEKKQLAIIDYKGETKLVNIQTRSALERTVKQERDLIANAGPNDLVPVEVFEILGYLHGGSTSLRVGDDIYHFGHDGWSVDSGTEGVKGALLSNPYLRWSVKTARGMGLPPFNIGVKIMIPKATVERVKEVIQAQMNLPESQRPQFDAVKNNCVHLLMRAFQEAGYNIIRPGAFSGFSSSLSFRELVEQPIAPVDSINLYPMPGYDLTEAQLRNEFPHFAYRAYSVKEDFRLIYGPRTAKERYHEAMLLEIVGLVGDQGQDAVGKLMLESGAIDDENELAGRLQTASAKGWITLNPLTLTSEGRAVGEERAKDYDLSLAMPRK